jgi:hypothetical protein
MNSIIHGYAQRLEEDAEKIAEGLKCLGTGCSSWARTQEEKDLKDLAEDLQNIENDVSLISADCILAGCQLGEDPSKVLLDDFREIFGCLDALFNGLKKARIQLNNAYIHPTILEHLGVECGRFRKLIGQVQRHLNEQQHKTANPWDAIQVHLVQRPASTP